MDDTASGVCLHTELYVVQIFFLNYIQNHVLVLYTVLCIRAFLYVSSSKFCIGVSTVVMSLNRTVLLNRTGGVVWAMKPP